MKGEFIGTTILTATTNIALRKAEVQTMVATGSGTIIFYDRLPRYDPWRYYSGGTKTYQHATTTEPVIVWDGSTLLTKGAGADTLNDEEWFWVSNVLYYRNDTLWGAGATPDTYPSTIQGNWPSVTKEFPPHNGSSILTTYSWPAGILFRNAFDVYVSGTASLSLSYG